jgi:3-oxoadipate enol-lactonase
MPLLAVNGARVHYDETGSGPETIVFAHGLLWSGRMYRFQVAHLKDRYRCITFDFRGQGRSEVTRGGYDMDTLTEDAAALIGELGAAPCHFVGLSMGGFVGLRLAIRRPELLRSLILMETAADPEPRLNIPKYAAMAAAARLLGFGLLAEPVMKIMFGEHFRHDAARAGLRREMKEELVGNHLTGATRATLGILGRRSVEEELGRITVPSLVLHGAADTAIAPSRARRMANRIASAKMVMIPRAGHTSTIEEPDAVNAALDEFLGGLRGA